MYIYIFNLNNTHKLHINLNSPTLVHLLIKNWILFFYFVSCRQTNNLLYSSRTWQRKLHVLENVRILEQQLRAFRNYKCWNPSLCWRSNCTTAKSVINGTIYFKTPVSLYRSRSPFNEPMFSWTLLRQWLVYCHSLVLESPRRYHWAALHSLHLSKYFPSVLTP